MEGFALKLLMAWHIVALIASIIAIIKSSIIYSRKPNEISEMGRVLFCTLGELFSINLVCCVVGFGKRKFLKKYNYIFHSFIRVQFCDHSQSVQATAAKMGTTKTAKRTQHPTSWFWIISL